jgi:DNA methylase
MTSARAYTGQSELFAEGVDGSASRRTSGTFVDNMRLPVHRWFRYSAGFSAEWVEQVIRDRQQHGAVSVFDPFAGSGTTLLCAERLGVPSWGVEAHPFIARVAAAKLLHHTPPAEYARLASHVAAVATRQKGKVSEYPQLIRACFSDGVLAELDCLRTVVASECGRDPAGQLVWLTLVAMLRSVSRVGTAPWQYILPNKRKQVKRGGIEAFRLMSGMVLDDLTNYSCMHAPAVLLQADARTCEGVPTNAANLVICSPPYANNYDYADATRLEMTFMGEIAGWGDLQESVRQHLVRSCSQHVPTKSVDLTTVLASPTLDPIRSELAKVCEELGRVRMEKGGRKTYHLMLGCYFLDMAHVWSALRRVCQTGSTVCFVLGDSAPYGVYAPVVEWNGALALASGFNAWNFEKIRDRNTKWKNRKHRVPLQEGRLWVEG